MKKILCLALSLLVSPMLFCGCAAGETPEVSRRVTLLLEEEKRIITLDYTEYIAGCIFSVAEPSYEYETLVAVGTACSGRAVRCMKTCGGEFYGADFSDSSAECPEWISLEEAAEQYGAEYDENLSRVMDAASAAASLCPVYEGEPADTRCCALSSGFTDSGGEDYLPALELPLDLENLSRKSQAILTADIVRAELKGITGSVILPPDRGEWFSDAVYSEHGALISICFGGKAITGRQLMKALGLRSVCIEIECSRDEFTFKVSGRGCNCGMSVYTAEGLARAGKSAEEIIQYFFPGVTLERVHISE